MVDTQKNSRSPRLGLQLNIRLYLDGEEPLHLTTRNISNTGLFIDCETPLDIQEGQQVCIELAETLADGETQKVRTTVVRIEKEGFALKYNEV
ncbi:MAG: PilZ domain-containing protein [Gammaproteobacteria bacterium]